MDLPMSAPRVAFLCLLAVVVTACGGSGGGAPASDQHAISQMFASIDTAMARGDYATACNDFSRREQATLVASAKQGGYDVSSCPGTFAALIKATGITRGQLAEAFGTGPGLKIDTVTVQGNQATVSYTDRLGDRSYTETDGLVREGGTWKADRIIHRSQTH